MIHIQRCIICDPYITFVTRFDELVQHIYTLCKSTFFLDEWIDLDLDMCLMVLNVLGFFFHRIDNFISHGKDE